MTDKLDRYQETQEQGDVPSYQFLQNVQIIADEESQQSGSDQNQRPQRVRDDGFHKRDGSAFDIKQEINDFWPNVRTKISQIDSASIRDSTRHQELPLARIKKIMKLDDDVKCQMISSEAPILLAKACEIFIQELTLCSWFFTEESGRKTLQKSDLSQAVSSNEMYDFLIDIVPRDDLKKANKKGLVQVKTDSVVQAIPAAAVDDGNLSALESGGMQFVLQVGQSEGALETGSVVQATPIGQPIQLPLASNDQPIQLIALNLPDGNVQQFQVQLPSVNL